MRESDAYELDENRLLFRPRHKENNIKEYSAEMGYIFGNYV